MFEDFLRALARPVLYQEMEAAFWEDGHISGQMLAAHLDPLFEGASRKRTFIERSAAWIRGLLPPSDYPAILDAGCGPGLYAERFAAYGYQVTGVDFSQRSIQYARASAEQKGLAIDYRCQNYLSLELERSFAAAVMIYCDYGVLSPANRQRLLARLYQHLRPGGRLLLDVFSVAKYNAFEERQSFEALPRGGFWSAEPYAVLNLCAKYEPQVTLEQSIVLTEAGSRVYYLWNTYFTPETLAEEAQAAGFKVVACYGDVCGSAYDEKSPTLAVLLEK